jgi:hypothetical protein
MKITTTPPIPQSLDLVDVVLTVEEGRLLLQSLQLWAEAADAGDLDPGWHTHLDLDSHAPELTIAITPAERA